MASEGLKRQETENRNNGSMFTALRCALRGLCWADTDTGGDGRR